MKSVKIKRVVCRIKVFCFLSIALVGGVYAGPSDPDITKVPQPILDEHPGWIDLYKRTWELGVKNVKPKMSGTIFIDYYMDEGFSDNIFQWDTSFMMMFGRYSNGELPSIVSLENFYMNQASDGWISREQREDGSESYWPKDGTEQDPDKKLRENCSINPPLFSWAEWSDYQISGDASRFTKKMSGPEISNKTILQVLVDYFDWIKEHRRWDNGMYWSTSYANGMDDNPRLFPNGVLGSESAIGGVCDNLQANWVDITAQQALNAYYVAKIAGEVGETEIQTRFEHEHAEIKTILNTKMWDTADKIYYDLNPDESFHKVKTPASFWPMVARVTSPEQAQDLVDHIVNPEEFWTLHHIPTVAADEETYEEDGGYWVGSVWAPTLYETVKGLEAQGFHDVAKKVSINHIQNLYWVYRDSNTLYENYHQESPSAGKQRSKPDFVGWTGVGPIACLIENVMGFLAFGPRDSLDWNLTLAERHGLENFKFGDNTVTIVAEDRLNSESGAIVSIDSDSPFTLHVSIGETEYVENVSVGKTEYMFGVPLAGLSSIPIIHKATESYGFGGVGDELSRYQTFVANENPLLAGVDVKVRRLNGFNQSEITVDLFATAGGVPTGTSLAQGVIAPSEVDNFFSILHSGFEYSGLESGAMYAIVLSQKTPKSDNYEWVNGEDVDSELSFGKGDGSGWTDESELGDAWMKVYVVDPTAEPLVSSVSQGSSDISNSSSSIVESSSSVEDSQAGSVAYSSSESSNDVSSSSGIVSLFYFNNSPKNSIQYVTFFGNGELIVPAPELAQTGALYNVRGELLINQVPIVDGMLRVPQNTPHGMLFVMFDE